MNFLHTLNLSSIKLFFKKCRISNPNIRFVQNRPKIHRWTEEELETLRIAVNKHGNKWKYISDNYFPLSRTPIAVQRKWNIINKNMSRPRKTYYNKWTEKEDKILKYGIEKYGIGKWKEIEKLFDTKDYGQILLRWESIEDEILLRLVKNYGRKWKMISDVIGKNYFRCRDRYEVLISKPWTKEETEKLHVSILKYKQDWRKIADEFPDRTLVDIRKHKRNASTNPNFKLGRWNDIEINSFKKAIKEHGKLWIKVSQIVGTRSPRQCIQELYAKLLAEIVELRKKFAENKVKNDDLKDKNAEIPDLRRKFAKLEAEKTELKARVAELLKQGVENKRRDAENVKLKAREELEKNKADIIKLVPMNARHDIKIAELKAEVMKL
ncbi:hypothetical protein C1646_769623 [Rhizophagus diaphanus]|nr:hypothetical protein C1646_769623 [Rhizophagus diaphanus] [Rhizophagus sp. MUCL 43196]